MVLSCSADFTLKLWDTKNGNCLKTFEGHLSRIFLQFCKFLIMEIIISVVSSCCFSNDGMIASSSYDKTIILWNAKQIHLFLTQSFVLCYSQDVDDGCDSFFFYLGVTIYNILNLIYPSVIDLESVESELFTNWGN